MKELFDIENIRERVMSDSAKVCGITSIKKEKERHIFLHCYKRV